MGTLVVFVGGLAFVGWIAEAVRPSGPWCELERRWNEPVKAPPSVAKQPRPRRVHPAK